MKKIDVTQPYAMTSPFAEGVYSSVSTSDFEIPAETSTTPDDTCVIDDGFLPITSTDLDDGGIAPERKNFNGMFYLSTDQRFYLQNGGFITYNSNVATAIGGYPQDAVLGFIDGQGTYKLVRSLIDDNTNDFTQDETLIDGEHWEEIAMGGGGSSYQLFDIVMKDHVLDYAETLGLAPLGTYVYKEAIAGTRYGYPDFYQKCVDEYQDLNNTTDTVDSTTVTINANGHKFYDIADKATFDNIFGITGECWYYGIDTTNERIFLPRSTRFKNGTTSDVGGYNPAGLPNILASFKPFITKNSSGTGAIQTSKLQDWTTTAGTGTLDRANAVFNASLSNPIYGASSTVEYSSTKLIPYMVVGNQSSWEGMTDVVNNGLEILQEVNEGLETKLDAETVHIIDTYENQRSGYIIYSNGYCEQWGYFAYTNVTVALLKTYKNTDYNILFGKGYSNNTNTRMPNVNNDSITTNSFYVSGTYNNTAGTDCYFWWRTCGYLEEGQY